ncbi:MAG: 2,3-bisphosphoglycerate-dependent phosphoglycerate mutase [Candidatus Hydrogenedentota bacterium]|jgi:phosphohistidine phosphatase
MKRLLIMRHAKSDHGQPGLADHDRPLNARGLMDAPRMGARLRELGIQPDLIIASTANRALHTACLFAEGNDSAAPVQQDGRLYLAPVSDYLAVLQEVPATADTVLIVSHNPGSEELLQHLTGQLRAMPTAAIACVTFDDTGHVDLADFWTPKD